MESIDRNNCSVFLAAFIEQNKLSVRKVAKAITCSEITLNRIIAGKTLPSDEMLRQSGIMIEGEAEFTLGDEVKIIGAGDAYSIPPDVPHGAKFTKASIVVDAFYPPRQDFLD